MSARRRSALLAWARDVEGLVLEDDYDAEFRYQRGSLACLQAMDADHVALLGSVSKTLSPALRLGWVVAPPHLVPRLRGAKRDDDFGNPALDQLTLARFLQSGLYDQHLRAVRRRYRERREDLVAALGRALPDWRVVGTAGGLQLTVILPDGVREDALVAAAAGLGVAVLGLSPMNGKASDLQGLVLSFARSTPDMADEAARLLALAVEHTREQPPGRPSPPSGQLLWADVD